MCRFDECVKVWSLGSPQEQYDLQTLQDGSRVSVKEPHKLLLTLNCPVL